MCENVDHDDDHYLFFLWKGKQRVLFQKIGWK